MRYPLFAFLATATPVIAQDVIGSKGYSNISTGAFTLELDAVTQVATSLNAMAGVNAGDSDFNFLLPTINRTDNGNYVSVADTCRSDALQLMKS